MGEPRVLLLVDALWVGGTERSLVEMLPGLTAQGFDPVVVCLRRRDQGVEGEVPPERLRILPPGPPWARARVLRRLARELSADVVHSSLFAANMVARLARRPGTPFRLLNSLVSVPYDPARQRDPAVSTWRLRAVQTVDAASAHVAVDHFHAVSEAARQGAVRHLRLPPGRITVVRRGRDPQRLGEPSAERRRRVRDAVGVAADAQIVLSVGRQDFQKGQEHLLRAMGRLAPRHPRLELWLAGRPGPAATELVRLAAEPPLAGRVRLLGHRDDVPDLLAMADVFALPSLVEGFPGAVIEAMALALPVVASDIASVRELVRPGETGLLVPPERDEPLAAALETLLADRSLAAELGRRGRERFLAELTLEHSLRDMADLYRQLAGGGSQAAGAAAAGRDLLRPRHGRR